MMKKLILIFLGLASFNVYANGCPGQFDPVSGICRFQGHNGELIQYNMAPPRLVFRVNGSRITAPSVLPSVSQTSYTSDSPVKP